jgi:hypothetical protein
VTLHYHRNLARAIFSAALTVAALLALAPAAGAASRGPLPGDDSTLQLPSPAGPFPDSLIGGRRHLSREFGAPPQEQVFPVIGGQHVTMSSTYYSQPQMQSIADVLGGLVHGDEMNSLSVYVASPDEITQMCGPGTLACYAPSLSEMIVSGVDGSAYGVPRNYTIAHEYGHHIANNRLNAPWTALDTGAKRWATYEHVCEGTRSGRLVPGDEGDRYWDNPGEGFAETNAHLNFPAVPVPWGYNSLLRPSQASMAKLRADITSPWTGPTTATWNGSLWPERAKPADRRFSIPLDGDVDITLTGPEAANYDLYVLGDRLPASRHARERMRRLERRHGHHRRHHRKLPPRRQVVSRSVSPAASEQIQMQLCGRSSIQLEVRRLSGSGPFTVTVTRP